LTTVMVPDEIFFLLIKSISNINGIQSIGKTGTKELPESRESDKGHNSIPVLRISRMKGFPRSISE
jgi:hypothetical protein